MPKLSPARWQLLAPHLDKALDLSAGERDGFLASLRAEDAALAADLEELLEEERAVLSEGFLEKAAPTPPKPATLAGQEIGPYTLTALIGQGGMGNVWVARRSDGRFEGQVAVKLLNAGLMGRAGEERFRREGSILARLGHPNIARLLDAGVTPVGQPYLVLELVDGVPIDRYCDERGLGVPARLELFLDVLLAVAHAHANLIVHRDIKPSNVLVENGSVKLLDFGIAKLLEDETGGAATALTREGGRALTPEYAAPEQVTGGVVTTATDVYALGTLLHLLLAGRHPAEAVLRSPADLVKAIVETEPRRLSDTLADVEATEPEAIERIAERRAQTPEGLRRALRGDLETIVGKALKKDPVERYGSVPALADDIHRFLDHHPISARPDTPAYRARKFVRRHRVPVALGAAAVLALVAGLAGTLIQARRATRQATLVAAQRERADREARAAGRQRDFALEQRGRAEAINELNAFLLSDAAPSGKPFTVGELLARAEDVVGRDGGESDENRAYMLIAIGRQYSSHEETAKSLKLLGSAYDLAAKLQEPSLRARAACALGSAVSHGGGEVRAETLIQEGLRALPDEPQFALDRVYCLLRGSEVSRARGEMELGVERARAAQKLLADSRQGSALLALRVSMDVAESLRNAGRFAEAAVAFEQAFGRLSALGRAETETAGTLLNNWALAVDILGRHLEAERLYRRAVKISSADGSDRNVSPMLLNNLARSLRELGRLKEAADSADSAYAKARAAGNETVISQSLVVRSSIYRLLGDVARAEKLLDELEPRWKRDLPPGHAGFASLASERALIAQARHDLPRAKAGQDEALALAEKSSQRDELATRILLRRSKLQLEMKQFEGAQADAQGALAILNRMAPPGTHSSQLGRCYLALGKALRAQGKLVEARLAFTSAAEHLAPSIGADNPETLEAKGLLSATTGTPSG